jgi:CheY-like chemotaxis protein
MKTILIIEDSRMLRLAISRLLTKAGYLITAVGDGEQGLNKAEELRPDAILLDMMLPTMEGTAVLRQLKENPRTQAIPVLVLSGLSQKNEERLKAEGAAGYFEKSLLDFDTGGSTFVSALGQLLGGLPR